MAKPECPQCKGKNIYAIRKSTTRYTVESLKIGWAGLHGTLSIDPKVGNGTASYLAVKCTDCSFEQGLFLEETDPATLATFNV